MSATTMTASQLRQTSGLFGEGQGCLEGPCTITRTNEIILVSGHVWPLISCPLLCHHCHVALPVMRFVNRVQHFMLICQFEVLWFGGRTINITNVSSQALTKDHLFFRQKLSCETENSPTVFPCRVFQALCLTWAMLLHQSSGP